MKPEQRRTKIIYFHKEMEPKPKIEIFTVTLNGELVKGVSIALYSPIPDRDWCVELTKDEALNMARKIIEIYGEPLNEK